MGKEPAILLGFFFCMGIQASLLTPASRLNGLKPYGRNPPNHGLKPRGLQRVQTVKAMSTPHLKDFGGGTKEEVVVLLER